jgi:hypothetical protein
VLANPELLLSVSRGGVFRRKAIGSAGLFANLSYIVNVSELLDRTFMALTDPTRRAILAHFERRIDPKSIDYIEADDSCVTLRAGKVEYLRRDSIWRIVPRPALSKPLRRRSPLHPSQEWMGLSRWRL